MRNSADRRPSPLRALAGTKHADFAGRQPHHFLHEGASCNGHLLTFLPQAYLRALPVCECIVLQLLLARPHEGLGTKETACWPSCVIASFCKWRSFDAGTSLKPRHSFCKRPELHRSADTRRLTLAQTFPCMLCQRCWCIARSCCWGRRQA